MDCIVCRKEFSPDDDIVVCETCGTPYHRKCYKSVGKCINIEYHAEGLTFNQMHSKVEEPVTTDSLNALKDSSSNENGVSIDYTRTVEVSSELIQQVNLAPYEKCNGITLLEYYLYTKSLIGTEKFYKHSTGRKVSNWLGFIFPTYYLASKKLYVQAVVTFLIEFVITIPIMMTSIPIEISQTLDKLTSTNTFSVITIVSVVLDLIFRKIIADKSIAWYFDSTVKNIKSIQQGSHSEDETFRKLIDSINTNNFLAVLVAFICSNVAYYSFSIVLILVINFFGT